MCSCRKSKCHAYSRLLHADSDKVYVDLDFLLNEVSEEKHGLTIHIKLLLTAKGSEGIHMQR